MKNKSIILAVIIFIFEVVSSPSFLRTANCLISKRNRMCDNRDEIDRLLTASRMVPKQKLPYVPCQSLATSAKRESQEKKLIPGFTSDITSHKRLCAFNNHMKPNNGKNKDPSIGSSNGYPAWSAKRSRSEIKRPESSFRVFCWY